MAFLTGDVGVHCIALLQNLSSDIGIYGYVSNAMGRFWFVTLTAFERKSTSENIERVLFMTLGC